MLDKNVLLDISFSDGHEIAKKGVLTGGVEIVDDGMKFNTSSKLTANSFQGLVKTVFIELDINDVSFDVLVKFNSSENLSVTATTLFATGIANANLFVDGVDTDTISANSKDVFLTTDGISDFSLLNFGDLSYKGIFKRIVFFDYVLDQDEIDLFRTNQMYVVPSLSSVLSISALRGIIESNLDFTNNGVEVFKDRNYSADYNGVDTDLSFGSGEEFSFLTSKSICFWAKLRNVSATTNLIAKDDIISQREWSIGVFVDNKLRFYLKGGLAGTIQIGRETSAILKLGEWQFHCITYDGGNLASGIKIYTNGVQTDVANTNSGTFTGSENGTEPLRIGRRSSNYADGLLDQVQLFDSVLTNKQIKQLFHSQKHYFGVS